MSDEADDIASLGFDIDSSKAVTAHDNLDRMADASVRAQKAQEDLTKSTREYNDQAAIFAEEQKKAAEGRAYMMQSTLQMAGEIKMASDAITLMSRGAISSLGEMAAAFNPLGAAVAGTLISLESVRGLTMSGIHYLTDYDDYISRTRSNMTDLFAGMKSFAEYNGQSVAGLMQVGGIADKLDVDPSKAGQIQSVLSQALSGSGEQSAAIRKKFESMGVSFDGLGEGDETALLGKFKQAFGSMGGGSAKASRLHGVFGSAGDADLYRKLNDADDGDSAVVAHEKRLRQLGLSADSDIAAMNDATDDANDLSGQVDNLGIFGSNDDKLKKKEERAKERAAEYVSTWASHERRVAENWKDAIEKMRDDLKDGKRQFLMPFEQSIGYFKAELSEYPRLFNNLFLDATGNAPKYGVMENADQAPLSEDQLALAQKINNYSNPGANNQKSFDQSTKNLSEMRAKGGITSREMAEQIYLMSSNAYTKIDTSKAMDSAYGNVAEGDEQYQKMQANKEKLEKELEDARKKAEENPGLFGAGARAGVRESKLRLEKQTHEMDEYENSIRDKYEPGYHANRKAEEINDLVSDIRKLQQSAKDNPWTTQFGVGNVESAIADKRSKIEDLSKEVREWADKHGQQYDTSKPEDIESLVEYKNFAEKSRETLQRLRSMTDPMGSRIEDMTRMRGNLERFSNDEGMNSELRDKAKSVIPGIDESLSNRQHPFQQQGEMYDDMIAAGGSAPGFDRQREMGWRQQARRLSHIYKGSFSRDKDRLKGEYDSVSDKRESLAFSEWDGAEDRKAADQDKMIAAYTKGAEAVAAMSRELEIHNKQVEMGADLTGKHAKELRLEIDLLQQKGTLTKGESDRLAQLNAENESLRTRSEIIAKTIEREKDHASRISAGQDSINSQNQLAMSNVRSQMMDQYGSTPHSSENMRELERQIATKEHEQKLRQEALDKHERPDEDAISKAGSDFYSTRKKADDNKDKSEWSQMVTNSRRPQDKFQDEAEHISKLYGNSAKGAQDMVAAMKEVYSAAQKSGFPELQGQVMNLIAAFKEGKISAEQFLSASSNLGSDHADNMSKYRYYNTPTVHSGFEGMRPGERQKALMTKLGTGGYRDMMSAAGKIGPFDMLDQFHANGTIFDSDGVVDRPTRVNGRHIIGEGGPEAVVPVNRGGDGYVIPGSHGGRYALSKGPNGKLVIDDIASKNTYSHDANRKISDAAYDPSQKSDQLFFERSGRNINQQAAYERDLFARRGGGDLDAAVARMYGKPSVMLTQNTNSAYDHILGGPHAFDTHSAPDIGARFRAGSLLHHAPISVPITPVLLKEPQEDEGDDEKETKESAVHHNYGGVNLTVHMAQAVANSHGDIHKALEDFRRSLPQHLADAMNTVNRGSYA